MYGEKEVYLHWLLLENKDLDTNTNKGSYFPAVSKEEVKQMANILVCDDDKEIVDAIEIYLLQEGYQIYKAYDGEQAIRILKERIMIGILEYSLIFKVA